MIDLMQEKKVAENKVCIFYTNTLTEAATRYARKENSKGFALDNYAVFIAESRTNKLRDFVLLNEKNEIIEHSDTNNGIEFRIEQLKILKQMK